MKRNGLIFYVKNVIEIGYFRFGDFFGGGGGKSIKSPLSKSPMLMIIKISTF